MFKYTITIGAIPLKPQASPIFLTYIYKTSSYTVIC